MKRLSRRWKLTLLAFGGIVGLGLIGLAVSEARARAALEVEIDRLRAAGEPLSLAELKPKPIPPEKNAATYLDRAKDDVLAINKEVNAAENAATAAGVPERQDGELPSPTVLDAMRKALAAYPKVMPLLIQASECPDYDAQFDYTVDGKTFVGNFLPTVQDMRASFRVLFYSVQVSLADGKADDAVQSCRTMFRLVRLFDRGPMLINYLISLALRGVTVAATNQVLRSGPLPPAAYDALELELSQQDLVAAYRHTLRTERGFGMQEFADFLGPPASVVKPVWPGFKRDQLGYLKLMTMLIETADRPYSDSRARAQASVMMNQAGPLTQSIAPAVHAVQSANCCMLAKIRALRILIAILRLENVGKSVEPSLEALDLPPDAKADPYNGEPMRLKKSPEGWTIYSVGVDGRDDGGVKLDSTSDEDAGIGPAVSRRSGAAPDK